MSDVYDSAQEYAHFGRYYGTLYRKTVQFTREATKSLGLTWTEIIVLLVALDNPGTAQDNIATHLSIDKAVAARALKHLEQRGLIERRTDPNNQRAKMVYATEAAAPIKAHYDRIITHLNKMILGDYSDVERKKIISAFKQMRDRAEAIDVKAEVAKLYDQE